MTLSPRDRAGRRDQVLAAAGRPRPSDRALATVGFLLSALCLVLGVATANGSPDRCLPGTGPWRSDVDPMAAAEPVALVADRIDACSSLVPVGVDAARQIEVPSVHTPEQAGWYRHGPTPGEQGPAVIVGHVDGDGRRGVFADLVEARPEDVITVVRRDGSTAVFAVTHVEQVPKDSFPTGAVYGNTTGAELRLITCGGALDPTGHSYEDNVIVYAGLVGRS
ncbi:class F sortase [Actinomycetospora sp. CA-101289]|uniref:class F sortase n=1 Tax=Actinomycetospora sp. CA-101289 TaxID=3239893 RepID=UPI003D988AF0